jgi:cysteinyl-tRNA synthetase
LEAVRLFMLTAHYRSPINFSRDQITAANTSLNRLYTARDNLLFFCANGEDRPMNDLEASFAERLKNYEARFDAAMDDDLNTADAITAIFELVKIANVSVTEESTKAFADYVLEKIELLMSVLGIKTVVAKDDLDSEVEKLIEERQAARKAKDFAKADEIRDKLLEMGIILKDTREGVKWSRA